MKEVEGVEEGGMKKFVLTIGVAMLLTACGDRNAPPQLAEAPFHGQRDPVCGMMVDPRHPPAKTDYKGKTYYFCSREDKERFDKNPAKYIQ